MVNLIVDISEVLNVYRLYYNYQQPLQHPIKEHESETRITW
jgi:hypothetical protein